MIKYHLFILFFLFFCSCKNIEKKPLALLESGNKKMSRGKTKKAYKDYYRAAELSNISEYYVLAAEAYYLGHDNSRNSNVNYTLEIFNKAFRLSSWNTTALFGRAKYFYYLGRNDNCIRDLDSLLKRDKQNLDGYFLKAGIYMTRKDTAKGFETYNEALHYALTNQDKAEIYIDRAFRSYSIGLWEDSKNNYLRSKNISDTSKFIGYCILGLSYYNLGVIDSACYYSKFCEKGNSVITRYRKQLLLNCKEVKLR